MNQRQKALILNRNKQYFAEIPFLPKGEVKERAEVATLQEIELIALLNYMEAERRKSLDNFINNYGNFSDELNRIYNLADSAVFNEDYSPFSERFSEIQREEWNKLLPVTLKRLKKAEENDETAIFWLFAANRAERAARNNTNSLFNCKRFVDLKKQGYRYKQWHTIIDGRERATHAVANNQVVPIDQPFIVGGFQMMFPRDISFGAPPREILNCRCSITGR